jgi:hypothetical protein
MNEVPVLVFWLRFAPFFINFVERTACALAQLLHILNFEPRDFVSSHRGDFLLLPEAEGSVDLINSLEVLCDLVGLSLSSFLILNAPAKDPALCL